MTSKLNTYPSQQVGMGIVRLDFSFEGNGGFNPEADSIQGDMGEVASIARTGTGSLAITLKDPFVRLIGLTGSPQSAAGEATGAIYADGPTNQGTGAALVIDVKSAVAADFVVGERYFISMVLQTFTAGTR
jgi:hypothetical protein